MAHPPSRFGDGGHASKFDITFSMGDIIFVLQYWHQRDRRRGPELTEAEIEGSKIGKRLGQKMLKTWGYWKEILQPGHFALAPGEIGLDPGPRSLRVKARVLDAPPNG